MTSSIPHVVITTESAICEGGHLFSSQRLSEMAFGIYHTFAASGFLTNTTHSELLESLQRIIIWWFESLDRYEQDLAEAEGKYIYYDHTSILNMFIDQIIPHKLNFTVLEDVIGLLMITNVVSLGSILDSRRYLKTSPLTMDTNPLSETTVLKTDFVSYSLGKTTAAELLDWVYARYHLCVIEDGVVKDPENQSNNLRRYRNSFLVQQAKALVIQIKEARDQGIKGENDWVSAEVVRLTIEKDFQGDEEFMALWPLKEEWQVILAEEAPLFTPRPSYSFPLAPEGCMYKMTLAK